MMSTGLYSCNDYLLIQFLSALTFLFQKRWSTAGQFVDKRMFSETCAIFYPDTSSLVLLIQKGALRNHMTIPRVASNS